MKQKVIAEVTGERMAVKRFLEEVDDLATYFDGVEVDYR